MSTSLPPPVSAVAPEETEREKSFLVRIRRTFFTGLLLLLPLIITVILLHLLFSLVNAYITPLVAGVINLLVFLALGEAHPFYEPYQEPISVGLGLLLTLLVVFGVGLLARNLLGKRLLKAFDRLMLRIPVVKGIYGAAQQVMETLRMSRYRGFSQVVLVEYPRRGCYTMGFLTGEFPMGVGNSPPGSLCNVFVPTTPNPTSGWVVVLPRDEVLVLNMTVEEGFKFIISGGIISPVTSGAFPPAES